MPFVAINRPVFSTSRLDYDFQNAKSPCVVYKGYSKIYGHVWRHSHADFELYAESITDRR